MTHVTLLVGIHVDSRRVIAILGATSLLSLYGLSLKAQETRSATPIPQAAAVVSEQFRFVASVRALPDGRALLTDIFDDHLVVVDWTTGSATVVGRKGRGPGEYLEVGRLFPLGRDSTVLEDPTLRQWLLIEGTKIRGRLNPKAAYATDLVLSGVDRTGRYLEVHPVAFGRSTVMRTARIRAFAESLAAIAIDPRTGRADTIASLLGGFRGVGRSTKAVNGTPMTYVFWNPLASEEQAFMFADGWVALLLRDPYRVDWIPPSGGRQRGERLDHRVVAVDAEQKQAALDRKWTGELKGLFSAEETPGWPEHLPPFLSDAGLALPDGRLLVRRTPDATRAQIRYDIIDRRGRISAALTVAPNQRIVGASFGSLFVATADEDELETLSQHPWPPGLNRSAPPSATLASPR